MFLYLSARLSCCGGFFFSSDLFIAFLIASSALLAPKLTRYLIKKITTIKTIEIRIIVKVGFIINLLIKRILFLC